MAMFFPREPFLALKDVKDPSAYWDKLVKEYKAHIHSYHKKLGKKAAEAEFESLEALHQWRDHPEHLDAQRAGREKFYAAYDVRVCSVERAYAFPRERALSK